MSVRPAAVAMRLPATHAGPRIAAVTIVPAPGIAPESPGAPVRERTVSRAGPAPNSHRRQAPGARGVREPT